MKTKKGDNVLVIARKDNGKTGKVERAFPKEMKVLVSGINMQKRHQKPRKSNEKGQVVTKAVPLHVSNVMLVDPKSGKATRVGSRMVGEKKVRFAKKSGSEI